MNHQQKTLNTPYAFGMPMPGRYKPSPSGDEYRFGFNGMEKDDEWKGEGNSLDFGARIYDSRVGRWLATDQYKALFPSYSPYNFAANNPISVIDVDGNIIKLALQNVELGYSFISVINSAFNDKVVAEVVSTNKGDFLKVQINEGIDPSSFTEKEAAAYSNLVNMMQDNTVYNIEVGKWEISKTTFEGYNEGIFPENISNLPNEGYYDQLYVLDHFFREQRLKNDDLLNVYEGDHRNTESEQADNYYKMGDYNEIFGEPNDLGGRDFKVQDRDVLDKDGNYLSTVRLERNEEGKISSSSYNRKGETVGSPIKNSIKLESHFENNPTNK